jgi:hypothetical protein
MNFWQKYKKGKPDFKKRRSDHRSNRGIIFVPFLLGAAKVLAIAGAAGAFTYYFKDEVSRGVSKTLYVIATGLATFTQALYNYLSIILNKSIHFSLSNMAIDIKAIELIWTVVRDFANLSLIFILTYISISTVLGLNGSNTYKLLGKLILVGLLMNFSLVFTNVIIDFSNIVAIQFLTIIEGKGPVGDVIGKTLSVDKILDQQFEDIKPDAIIPENALQNAEVMFGISIFFLTIIFVMAKGAFLFLVRILKLMGVMIFSPLAFAAIILPKTEKYATQWWEELSGNAFLAPAYLFMMYISLSIMSAILPPAGIPWSIVVKAVLGVGGKVPDTRWEVITQLFFGFSLGIGMLSLAAKVAAKMSSDTAAAGGRLANLAFGTALGGVAAGGRLVGGSLGQAAYQGLENYSGAGASTLRGFADVARKGTYDIRNAPVVGTAVEQAAGVAGASTKEGLIFKDAKASGGGRQKEIEDKKTEETKKAEAEKVYERRALLSDPEKMAEKYGGEYSSYNSSNPADRVDFDKDVQKQLKGLDNDSLLSLVGNDVSDPSKAHLFRNLNSSQVKTLLEKGGLDDANKTLLKNAVIGNKDNNKDGSKHYADEIKKEVEDKAVEDFENFATSLTEATSSVDIRNRLITLKPNVVVRVREQIMAKPEIQRELQAPQLDAFLKDFQAGGETTAENMIALDQNVRSASGRRFLDSGRVRDVMPEAAPIAPPQPPAGAEPNIERGEN